MSVAARTLGSRTRNPGELKEAVQSRFMDALAAVAANMTMEEIHSNRGLYMRNVAAMAALTLASNGLELENASLTSLNQADIRIFNPDNAFDAEGLTQLTEQIEDRRKLRNQIENDARIHIKLKDFESEQRGLEIDRDLEYARIEQSRAVEVRKVVQLAEIEAERSSSAISITAAKVRTEQEGERVRIAMGRLIDSERINSATEIRTLEIERQRDTELAEINSSAALETRRLSSRQEVEGERIDNERKVREIDIRSRQDISISESNAAAKVDQTRLDSERETEQRRIETSHALELLGVERDRDLRVNTELAAAEQERATINKRYAVDLERLRKDEEIVQFEILRNQKIKLAESDAFRQIEDATITAGRKVDELRIAARKFIDRFEIEQQREVEIVDKDRLIALVNKSIEEAVARTEAATAEKTLAAVEEQIVTVRAEEVANRSRSVELIDAASKAGREAVRLVTIATADKEAAEQRALAEVAEANASGVRYARDAEGNRLLNETENMRSEASRRSTIYETLVKSLPSIIRETVKPMERIESIKILQVDGLPGLNSPSETGGGGGGGENISDRVVNSAMKYRTQVAFVDGLMKDLGLPLENLGSAGGMSFRNFPPGPGKGGDKDD